MSQSEPRRCHTASSNWLRIMRNQEDFCDRTTGAVLRGTESLLTHRWREADSNHRSLSYDQYSNGLKEAPELCAHGQPRCVRTREMRGRRGYPDNRMVR